MKILHTSDWHLGHLLYNDSQEEQQQAMLDQIADLIGQHQPDVLIISGDVYDTNQPSASVQQMFANAIVKMHEAYPAIEIVCIAGNHDSGSKHMIFHTPWKALHVHMIGNIVKDSNLDDYIIPIEGKGYVVAVPFVAERYLPDDVFKSLSAKVMERNAENLPVVLSAHMAASHADWRGHNDSSDTNIGGLDCQELSVFGDDYDYVALGHIHKQQKLDTAGRVWYAGTPIAVSFDECYAGNKHGVLLVETQKHQDPVTVTPIQITNPCPLINLPINGFTDWDEAKRLLDEFDNNLPAFIRLNVEVDGYSPVGANDEAQQIVENKQCRLSFINYKRKSQTGQTGQAKSLTTSEFKQLDFIEVAKMYIESQGDVFDDDMKQMLEEVKKQLKTNNQ